MQSVYITYGTREHGNFHIPAECGTGHPLQALLQVVAMLSDLS